MGELISIVGQLKGEGSYRVVRDFARGLAGAEQAWAFRQLAYSALVSLERVAGRGQVVAFMEALLAVEFPAGPDEGPPNPLAAA